MKTDLHSPAEGNKVACKYTRKPCLFFTSCGKFLDPGVPKVVLYGSQHCSERTSNLACDVPNVLLKLFPVTPHFTPKS